MKELLAAHGRQFATIRTEIGPIPPAAVGLTFYIKEGPKVKVGNIKFEGNKKVTTSQPSRGHEESAACRDSPLHRSWKTCSRRLTTPASWMRTRNASVSPIRTKAISRRW